MKVSIAEARSVVEKIFQKNGLTKRQAEIVADDYIEGELLGKTSHGLSAMVTGVYGAQFISISKKSIQVECHKNAYARINGNQNPGQLVADKARALVVKKAKKYGIGMVGTHNTLSFLRPGSQAEYISRYDLIAIIIHNGGEPLVAPHGGVDPLLSTTPIGFAIPTASLPIVADFATSEKAWGAVRLARAGIKKLPENAFLDRIGNSTIDVKNVFSALPFGGIKGFSLGILFEILTGSLVGSPMGVHKKFIQGRGKDRSTSDVYRGAIYIAIDPSKFVNIKKFKKENSMLVNELKSSRKMKGVKEIILPGEKAYALKEKHVKQGWFDVDDGVWEKIREL